MCKKRDHWQPDMGSAKDDIWLRKPSGANALARSFVIAVVGLVFALAATSSFASGGNLENLLREADAVRNIDPKEFIDLVGQIDKSADSLTPKQQ